jgi:hypothetical protein
MSYANSIKKMIEDGNDILQVAKLFGGIDKLLEISKTSPYLVALIKTKLGGYLHCSAEGEDEVMIPFTLSFIMTELEQVDFDDNFSHYNATVDIIIPELTDDKDMQMLYYWLDDYLSDMGSEVGSFNDGKLRDKMVWIYAEKINGKSFSLLTQMSVSDREVLEIIPNEYKGK